MSFELKQIKVFCTNFSLKITIYEFFLCLAHVTEPVPFGVAQKAHGVGRTWGQTDLAGQIWDLAFSALPGYALYL